MSVFEIIYFLSVVFFAGFINSLTGFGTVLVLTPLLSLVLDVKSVVPLMTWFAFCANTYSLKQIHAHIPWKKLSAFLWTAPFGVLLGTFVLKSVNAPFIQLLLGLVLTLFSSRLLFSKSSSKSMPHNWAYLIGFLSGFFGGVIGAAGPPVLIYISLQVWPKKTSKAFLHTFFVATAVMAMISHAFSGLVTQKVALYFLLGIPFLVAGSFSGQFLDHKVDEKVYRKILIPFILLLGLLMVRCGLTQLVHQGV